LIFTKDKMILYSFFLNRFSFQKLIRTDLFRHEPKETVEHRLRTEYDPWLRLW